VSAIPDQRAEQKPPLGLWHQRTGIRSGATAGTTPPVPPVPLVLLHGMGSASTAWKMITPGLAEQYEVIAFDLPGHGQSPWDSSTPMDPESLATIMRNELVAMGITRVHVGGNSLGGWVALELAAKYPELVQSVIALAPAGLWSHVATHRQKRGAIARYLAVATHRVAPYLMRYQWARRIGFAVVSPLWRELPLETCIDATIAYGTSPGYYPAWDGMLGRKFEKNISATIPVTIVFGDHDNTLPARHSQERSLAPAHCQWLRIDNAGHAPMWDHADEVIAIALKTMRASQS